MVLACLSASPRPVRPRHLPRLFYGPLAEQGFDEFFKDVSDWVRNDRLVVGVQLRLVRVSHPPDDVLAPSWLRLGPRQGLLAHCHSVLECAQRFLEFLDAKWLRSVPSWIIF